MTTPEFDPETQQSVDNFDTHAKKQAAKEQEQEQDWIFSVRLCPDPRTQGQKRIAVVGPARSSTVEAALHLAGAPENLRAEIRAAATVRKFVENALDPESNGYYTPCPSTVTSGWLVCIASIHEVIR